jgi:hypothetical protein
MDLDFLIGELRAVRSAYPGRKVKIATRRQVDNMGEGLRAIFQTPIADDSRLGDEDGSLDSLYIIVVDN